MLFMSFDDASSLEDEKETNDRLANDGNAALALVSAAGDDQHFARVFYLLLAQPRLGARSRGGGSRQCVAEVERALPSESHFVEGLSQSL